MAVEILPDHRPNIHLYPPAAERIPAEITPRPTYDRAGMVDWWALIRERQQRLIFPHGIRTRPLEPIEPDPFSLSTAQWGEYVQKRDEARKFAAENDLRGTF